MEAKDASLVSLCRRAYPDAASVKIVRNVLWDATAGSVARTLPVEVWVVRPLGLTMVHSAPDDLKMAELLGRVN